ncbi:dynamin family protein [Rhodococcus koreensis]
MTATGGGAQSPDIDGLRRQLEQILTGIGEEPAAQWLGPAFSADGNRAKIVIVGEVGTGKSSVINALLGRRDLLPVGAVAPTTATYVAVCAGTPETITVHLDNGRTLSDGDLAHLPRYVSAGGDQSRRVARAAVHLDAPRLAALTLIDTPGTGGLDSAYGRLTLDSLDNATALVFVCAAGNKISTSERDFLAQASRRIDRVVFLLTQIDDHPRWRESLQENEETVRADRARFPHHNFADITFAPVSAVKALYSPHQRERSGIDEIWAQLDDIARAHTHLMQLNELRTIKSAQRDAYAFLYEKLQALEAMSDPNQDDELTALHEQSTALSELNTQWRKNLDWEVRKAKTAVNNQLNLRVTQLRGDYQSKLATARKPLQVAEIESEVVTDLCALQLRSDTDLRQHAAEIARRMLSGVPGAEAAVTVLDAQLPAPEDALSTYLIERPPIPSNPAETLMGVQTSFTGWNMARNLVPLVLGGVGLVVPGGQAVVAALTLPVGAVWYRWHKKTRELAGEVAGVRTWIMESIGQARTFIHDDIDLAFTNASRVLQDTIEESLTDAQKQIDAAKQIRTRGRVDREAEQTRITNLRGQLIQLGLECDKKRKALLAQASAPTAGTLTPLPHSAPPQQDDNPTR